MRKVLALSTLALTLAACLPEGSTVSSAHADTSNPAPTAAPAQHGLPDFADLIERVGPAVVNISVVSTPKISDDEALGPFANDPFFDLLRRFGMPQPGQPGAPRGGRSGIGSGFIVSSDGYVLTNAHVAGDDDAELTVRLSDKREFKAKVIGTDRRTDIAVLKIDATGLPTVTIGDAERSRVGEWVLAIGSPFGFDHTVTAGIISAKARRLPDENYVPFLQTDVAINPGNSGGPLFNLDGRVIGINSQIFTRSGGSMGISFAIPIDVAMQVKDQLVQHGRVQRGRLGIYIQGVSAELAPSFGLSNAHGALVSKVEPDSAADKAGLKVGDVVLSVDGETVDDSVDLPRIIGNKHPGNKVKLQIWREGKKREVVAVLDELNQEDNTRAQSTPQPDKNSSSKLATLGLAARELSAQEARKLEVGAGLVVETVSGVAAKAGIQRGDIILALNNQPVGSVANFRQHLEHAGKRFALLIQRGDSRLFVPIKLD
ncbi:serine protease [Betaproteobacteria bacterium]|nr:serine protease [Betaproteobacteria bacterium]GHU04192.1 serine protease [Betaproteobacteria bacterium]GHU18331.1 serine protease [Betaproteobacteria bacterium]